MPEQDPYSEAQMLIRKKPEAVFEALANPEITSNFWFTKSSGKLVANQNIIWEWEMYGVSTMVKVLEIIPNEKISFEWGESKRIATFIFKDLGENKTYVSVKETGYSESGDALLAAIRNSTGGFTTVLDGMKAYLEHGLKLNLIGDKFPLGK